ncbi:MAG: hypothetical protein EPO57_03865 [Chitinophagaceae bacterium]|nr:MAG: hypothetical protein EPO57_03865 [Chitinophagaceae bacterium]
MKKTWAKSGMIVLLFIFLNTIGFVFANQLKEWGFDLTVLFYGNLLLFLVSYTSFSMSTKGISSKSNPVFFRWIYGSFMVKLFLLAGVALGYIMLVKEQVNKPAIIICMILYIVYSAFEVALLMKMLKRKNN